MYDIKNDFGTITITKSIITRIVVEACESFQGKVLLTNSKGKAPKITGKIGVVDESLLIEITESKTSEAGLDIRFFVLLRFGTSIKQVTNQLIDTVRSEMVAMTGVEPNSVTVVVKGMISKNIVKRSIEVKG